MAFSQAGFHESTAIVLLDSGTVQLSGALGKVVWGRTHSSVQRRRSRACGDAAASFEPRATSHEPRDKTGKGTSSTRADSASQKRSGFSRRGQLLRPSLGCNSFEINGVNVPEMGLVSRREGTPLPPSISGIIELAENRKLNLGAQSLVGKILMSKNLPIALPGSIPGTGRMRSPPTFTASTMIARLRGCAQGQMSHAPVEKKALRGKLCPVVELPHSSQNRA
jgi:hypothetical protein